MYTDELKVPMERVAVIIGKKGIVKKRLEKKTETRIQIISKEGDVLISGNDSLNVYNTKQIIKAIGRGFNPAIAELLLKDDYAFETIDIKSYSGGSKKKMARLKSRCIGTKGKAWGMIERLTGTFVSIYGKTIGVIGMFNDVAVARQAFQSLLQGAPHSNVYKLINRLKKD
jgi:ribosomal RNA assembly protein